MLHKVNLLFSLLVLGWHSACAQSISYSHRFYGTENGLASQEVYCVLEDQHGYMWFGTEAGVSRFNGYNFTNYSVTDGLTDNTIFGIYEDYKGRIWFLGFNNGICYFEHEKIHPFKYNEQLLTAIQNKGWVSRIVVDTNETVKFDMQPWGYGEIDRNGNSVFGYTIEDETRRHVLLKENRQGIMLSQSAADDSSAISHHFNEKENRIELSGFSGKSYAYSFDINPNESFFLVGHLLGYIGADTLMVRKTNAYVSSVYRDQRGRIWMSTRASGVQIYENLTAVFQNKDPLITIFPSFNVSQIIEDKRGGLWLSVENRGICYIYNIEVDNYLYDANQPNEISALCLGNQNDLYYATEKGVIYHLDSSGKHHAIVENCPAITALYFKEPNQLFVSSFQLSKEKIQPINQLDITFIWARGFCVNNENEMWKLGSHTATKWVNGKQVFETDEFNFFKTIYTDSAQFVWIGGNSGLFRYDGTKIQKVKTLFNRQGTDPQINQIKGYKDGMLAATKNDGLLFFKLINDSLITRRIPFPNDILKDVFIDNKGEFWIASNKGIIRLNPQSGKWVNFFRINHLHGMPSDQVNCIAGIGDWIYAGTSNGLVKFNKNEIHKNERPPKFQVESVLFNQEEFKHKPKPYQLKHSQNDFEISFVGLSYRNAGEVNYRYQLVGLDKKWKYTKSRNIRYPSLQPGSYQFQVSAANEDLVWCEPQHINFVINAPFWQKWWFLVFLGISLVGLIYWLYMLNERRRRRQFEKTRLIQEQKQKVIEAKLIALRSQMNPHFTFNTLAAIQNVMLNFSVNEAINYMTSFSMLVRRILENSEKLHIRIDEEMEMLRLYVELENLRFDNSIIFKCSISPGIQQDFIEIPSMIIQPFVENAIIHGLAPKKGGERTIYLNMTENETTIFCQIIDTGIGRIKAREIRQASGLKNQSLGIKITQERLKLFNDGKQNEFKFEITDCYTQTGEPSGTQVDIIFKKQTHG